MGWTIVFIVGLGLVALAGFLCVREHLRIKNAAIGDGVVVALEKQTSRHRRRTHTYYHPRVTFTAEGGREHTFTGTSGSNPAGYKVGEVVKVAYDRTTYEGRILSFGECFGVAVFVGVSGLAAMLTSATFIIGREVFAGVYLK